MALLRRILHPDNSTGGECYGNCVGVPPFCEPCIPPATIPVGSPPIPKWVFPPSPAGPWIDVNMTTSVVTHKSHRHVTLVALVISSILAAFFLLVTYYVLFLRVRAHLRRRRDAAAAAGGPGPSPDEDEGEGAAFFNQDNGGVHHVWFIRTVGLEQPMIDSITVCPYKSGDGLIESTDCSVCLSEFQDGELVRLLPKCCHAFHLPCIDTWLRSHINCPLCRAPIVAQALPSAAPVEAAASSADAAAAPVGGGPDPSVPAAAVVVSESTDADSSDDSSVGDEHQRTPSLRMIFAVPEDREETGILEDSASGTQSIPPAPQPPVASLSVAELGFRVQSDLGASRIQQHLRRDDEWVTIDLGPDRGIQPGRRSVSMDLSAMGALFHREEEESDDSTRGAVSSRKAQLPPCPRVALPATAAGIWMMKHGRDFKGCNNNLQKQALEMGRCSSTNSGGYIFSRLGRGRTRSHASILPL